MDEDPLLSDHPYGAQTARRPPPTATGSTSGQQDPLLSDHPYGSPTGGRPPPTGEYRYRSSIISQWIQRQDSKLPKLFLDKMFDIFNNTMHSVFSEGIIVKEWAHFNSTSQASRIISAT